MQAVEHHYDLKVAAIHKLRVNAKSLQAESRFIRQEERRCGKAFRSELAEHRRGRVREESRYTQLALSFVRGRPYKSVESKCVKLPHAVRLAAKVKQHMRMTSDAMIAEWLAK